MPLATCGTVRHLSIARSAAVCSEKLWKAINADRLRAILTTVILLVSGLVLVGRPPSLKSVTAASTVRSILLAIQL